jgi:DegV family protein with EDD domain
MSKIAICSDSSLDLTKELIEEYNIHIIPFGITLGDNTFKDGVDITVQDIFKYVEETKTLPKTNAINSAEYKDFYDSMLKDYDEVMLFCLSSEMSSSFNNAYIASQEYNGKVKVVDSRNLSTGVGMQVIYACELRNKGLSLDEIFDLVHKRRDSVQASFVVEKLNYLHKGGRCNSVQLLGANLLKIRPSIIVNQGKMGMHKKYRGAMSEVVYKYCKDTLEEFNNPCSDFCFITHSDAEPEMVEAAEKAVLESGKFNKVYKTPAGPTITSHCGKNTIGILYYNDGNSNN